MRAAASAVGLGRVQLPRQRRRRRRRRRRRNRARTQGHRSILIGSRFALLIKQKRCMLMRLNAVCMRGGVLYFQMSDGRRTAGRRGGDRLEERLLNVGYEKERPPSSQPPLWIRIPRFYIQRDLPLDAIQIERIVGS